MKKRFFFDRKEKNLQIDSEENSFERCVLCGAVTDVPVQMPVSDVYDVNFATFMSDRV